MRFLQPKGYFTSNMLILSEKRGLPFDMQKVTLQIIKCDTL